VYTRKASQKKLLTSLGETVDAWDSRETLVSLAFFEHLMLQVAGIFLTEALVTLGTISCSAGSSAIAGEVEGAAVESFGGSSSSLQEENKLCTTRQKEGKYGAIERTQKKALTMPGGRSILYLLQEQRLYQPLLSAERNSKKQICRLASSSYPRQYLQRSQEEVMSTN
jgi:hypothetical protein